MRLKELNLSSMKDKDIFSEAIEIEFKSPKVWTGLECDLIFGMSLYKMDYEKGTVELVQPYSEEFDRIMFKPESDE